MESWETDMDQLTEEMKYCNNSCSDSIDLLPDEVLIMMIASLPLKDRKNTRLFSRRWHNLNNIAQISRRERFLCRGVNGLGTGLQILHNSTKAVLNLEFIHCDFDIHTDQSFKFWAENGKRIESLSFTHCKLSEETVRHVIINCNKMKYFAIRNPFSGFSPCERGKELMSAPALETLINIRRGDLRSFKLEAGGDWWMSNNFLRVMFDVYPNIDDFSFVCPRNDFGDSLPSDAKLTFASIPKKLLESEKIMKSINLDSVPIERQAYFPRLTSIGKIYLQPVPEHPIFDFLSRHTHLRSIEFHVDVSENAPFLENLMNSLLDSSTQLESLKIEVPTRVPPLDERIFTKIKNSKLKTLHLNFLLKTTPYDENNTINETLKCFHLTRPVFGLLWAGGMVYALVRTFRGLSELILDHIGVDHEVLQDIFLYQRQLASLKLRSLEVYQIKDTQSLHGFTGIESGYSIKDFQKLECLEISVFDERMKRIPFEDFHLPNLKSLFLDTRIPQEFFREKKFSTHFKSLELLVVKEAGYLESLLWLKMCRQLKDLKFLYLETYFSDIPEFILSEKHEGLFKECPNLREFHWRGKFFKNGYSGGSLTNSYFLDFVTKRPRMVTNREEGFLPPDIIDPYWVRSF